MIVVIIYMNTISNNINFSMCFIYNLLLSSLFIIINNFLIYSSIHYLVYQFILTQSSETSSDLSFLLSEYHGMARTSGSASFVMAISGEALYVG